jgi:hypothetical protein
MGLRAPNVGGFFTDVIKPGLWAAGGLVGTRLAIALLKRVGLQTLLDKLPAPLTAASGTLMAAGGAFLTWKVTGFLGARMAREHRTLLAIGAGLAVIEEALAVILPRIGVGMQGGLVGEALYGGSLGEMGNCFTGACPWNGCGAPNEIEPQAQWAQQPMAGAQQQQGMGNCFTGACPWNGGPNCGGSGPQCCCPPGSQVSAPMGPPSIPQVAAPANGGGGGNGGGTPPIPPGAPSNGGGTASGPTMGFGLAGHIAVQRSGIDDPVVQGILAGMTARAQSRLDQVGYRG